MAKIIIIIALVALFIIALFLAWYYEYRSFNNGVCPKCGGKFTHFDTDSHGSRGYICEHCNHITWVGYPFIDNNYENKE